MQVILTRIIRLAPPAMLYDNPIPSRPINRYTVRMIRDRCIKVIVKYTFIIISFYSLDL